MLFRSAKRLVTVGQGLKQKDAINSFRVIAAAGSNAPVLEVRRKKGGKWEKGGQSLGTVPAGASSGSGAAASNQQGASATECVMEELEEEGPIKPHLFPAPFNKIFADYYFTTEHGIEFNPRIKLADSNVNTRQ